MAGARAPVTRCDAPGTAGSIEIASDGSLVHIRESDDPTTVVTTTRAKLHAWISGAKAGEFDHFVT
ncbi:DUF397 domain-containing protein [Kitasatospora aureofaciens]|uniref:DUF397 domain-containing protein n=1 Tax=Kitasatospora aureofaciens TaxID=1894 RepID=UPI0036F49722